MPLSLAEEADLVVGIDPVERFQDAGVQLGARARARGTCTSRWPTAWRCRFADGTFDLVLSHAVIEHVADAPLYLRECARVLAPRRPCIPVDGAVSVVRRRPPAAAEGAGAAAPDRRPARRVRHVPFLARHAPWTLKEPAHENSFIKARAARRGQARRPAREGPRPAAAPADRRRPACASSARSCTSTATVRRLPRRRRPLAARQPADAGASDQQHRIRAGADLGLRSPRVAAHRTPAGPARARPGDRRPDRVD